MSAEVNINDMQTQVEKRSKCARRAARKVRLAALGLAGLTYDAGKSVVHSADRFVHRAEVRGEKIEAALTASASGLQEQVTEEAKARRQKFEQKIESLSEGIGERGKALEKDFQNKLSSLKVGDGTVVETDQIKIEVEVVEAEPWTGYDELNAHEIIDELGKLTESELQAVREYESSTKNRVTILREIEMRLAALDEGPPSAADETTL